MRMRQVEYTCKHAGNDQQESCPILVPEESMPAFLQVPKLDMILADRCHCPRLTCVLITAKLLHSTLQSTYDAIDTQYASNS